MQRNKDGGHVYQFPLPWPKEERTTRRSRRPDPRRACFTLTGSADPEGTAMLKTETILRTCIEAAEIEYLRAKVFVARICEFLRTQAC
jgi:hypothetical protein